MTIAKPDGTILTQRPCGDWRLEIVSRTDHCELALRHQGTGEVVISSPVENVTRAKYDAYELWHEGEAIRTDYLAIAADKVRERREQREAAERAEEAAR